MSSITYQILAIDCKNQVVQVVTEDHDVNYLDRIVEARDGMTWIKGEPCSLEVKRK